VIGGSTAFVGKAALMSRLVRSLVLVAATVSATVLIGASAGSASAAASKNCFTIPGGQRPNGTITVALKPILGSPYGFPGSQPLGEAPFAVTGTLDLVVDGLICQLTP